MKDPKRFDYAAVEEQDREHVREHTWSVRQLLRRSADQVTEIGRRLELVRIRLKPREFQAWLRSEFGWSNRKAEAFINAYFAFTSCEHLDRFTPRAVLLLSTRACLNGALDEAIRMVNLGGHIDAAVAREIRERHGCGRKSTRLGAARRLQRPRLLEEADVMTVTPAVVQRALDELSAKVEFARPALSPECRRSIANRILEVVAVLR